MKSGFDIGKLKGDGYLILPLSMSRLAHGHGQDPSAIYETLEHFFPKLETLSNDVVLLYTYGLYFNTDETAFEARKKLNQQVLNHCAEMKNLIAKKKKFIPSAFHFLSFDYVILNSPYFGEFFDLLKNAERNNADFRAALQKDMGNREYNEANVNFLLEEIAVAHIVRQHLVSLPRTLVSKDIWRLVAYPGHPLNGDVFQCVHSILPAKDHINPYACGQYDVEKRIFVDFKAST